VGELRGSDLQIVEEQLGREPTTPFTVVARCAEGHPLVIRNHPLDADGRPFPTLFWLTCTEATKAVSRLESEGAIARLNRRLETTRCRRASGGARAYAAERAGVVPEAGGVGGVGGTRVGLKCLHAHYANHLAGGDDPVGAWVAVEVEPIHDERSSRVAAIDQGTNSIRLLVAEPDGRGGFRELARDMVITRLGRGVDETGRIDPEALQRTVARLAMYCRRARALHAERIRVGGTSVLRDASNGDDYERAVLEHAGSALEVIGRRARGRLRSLARPRGSRSRARSPRTSCWISAAARPSSWSETRSRSARSRPRWGASG
jgi:hypothetical protein